MYYLPDKYILTVTLTEKSSMWRDSPPLQGVVESGDHFKVSGTSLFPSKEQRQTDSADFFLH
jgi:hypothetical protein